MISGNLLILEEKKKCNLQEEDQDYLKIFLLIGLKIYCNNILGLMFFEKV